MDRSSEDAIKRKPIIGVMGGARVSDEVSKMAFKLGELVAGNGWILLNGGRDAGVMRASAEGAHSRGGLCIGILPGASGDEANPFIHIRVVTNLSDARNLVNVLTSDVVVACPGSAGTVSEVALALKNGRHVVLLQFDLRETFKEYHESGQLLFAKTPAECISLVRQVLSTT